jgi:hypothetical protein
MVEKLFDKKADEILTLITTFTATIKESNRESNILLNKESETQAIEDQCELIIKKIDEKLKEVTIQNKEEEKIEKQQQKKIDFEKNDLVKNLEILKKHVTIHVKHFKDMNQIEYLIRNQFEEISNLIKKDINVLNKQNDEERRNKITEKHKKSFKTIINHIQIVSKKIRNDIDILDTKNYALIRKVIQEYKIENKLTDTITLKINELFPRYNEFKKIKKISNEYKTNIIPGIDKINKLTKIIMGKEKLFENIIKNVSKEIRKTLNDFNDHIVNQENNLDIKTYIVKLKELDGKIYQYCTSDVRNQDKLDRKMNLYNFQKDFVKDIEFIEQQIDIIDIFIKDIIDIRMQNKDFNVNKEKYNKYSTGA